MPTESRKNDGQIIDFASLAPSLIGLQKIFCILLCAIRTGVSSHRPRTNDVGHLNHFEQPGVTHGVLTQFTPMGRHAQHDCATTSLRIVLDEPNQPTAVLQGAFAAVTLFDAPHSY